VLDSEIARLRAAIDHAAAVTEMGLAGGFAASSDEARWADDSSRSADQPELRRQLGALRERVAVAEDRDEGPGALRAELATLLSFARTLQADAENWRSALQDRVRDLERQRIAAERERERTIAERERLLRRRDALQSTILQTGARVAEQYRGECRRTLPVFKLWDGLTVCSVSVTCPRRGFRVPKQWLVTLTGSQDVLIRRE
jgi:chromosome segregation ATPase